MNENIELSIMLDEFKNDKNNIEKFLIDNNTNISESEIKKLFSNYYTSKKNNENNTKLFELIKSSLKKRSSVILKDNVNLFNNYILNENDYEKLIKKKEYTKDYIINNYIDKLMYNNIKSDNKLDIFNILLQNKKSVKQKSNPINDKINKVYISNILNTIKNDPNKLKSYITKNSNKENYEKLIQDYNINKKENKNKYLYRKSIDNIVQFIVDTELNNLKNENLEDKFSILQNEENEIETKLKSGNINKKHFLKQYVVDLLEDKKYNEDEVFDKVYKKAKINQEEKNIQQRNILNNINENLNIHTLLCKYSNKEIQQIQEKLNNESKKYGKKLFDKSNILQLTEREQEIEYNNNKNKFKFTNYKLLYNSLNENLKINQKELEYSIKYPKLYNELMNDSKDNIVNLEDFTKSLKENNLYINENLTKKYFYEYKLKNDKVHEIDEEEYKNSTYYKKKQKFNNILSYLINDLIHFMNKDIKDFSNEEIENNILTFEKALGMVNDSTNINNNKFLDYYNEFVLKILNDDVQKEKMLNSKTEKEFKHYFSDYSNKSGYDFFNDIKTEKFEINDSFEMKIKEKKLKTNKSLAKKRLEGDYYLKDKDEHIKQLGIINYIFNKLPISMIASELTSLKNEITTIYSGNDYESGKQIIDRYIKNMSKTEQDKMYKELEEKHYSENVINDSNYIKLLTKQDSFNDKDKLFIKNIFHKNMKNSEITNNLNKLKEQYAFSISKKINGLNDIEEKDEEISFFLENIIGITSKKQIKELEKYYIENNNTNITDTNFFRLLNNKQINRINEFNTSYGEKLNIKNMFYIKNNINQQKYLEENKNNIGEFDTKRKIEMAEINERIKLFEELTESEKTKTINDIKLILFTNELNVNITEEEKLNFFGTICLSKEGLNSLLLSVLSKNEKKEIKEKLLAIGLNVSANDEKLLSLYVFQMLKQKNQLENFLIKNVNIVEKDILNKVTTDKEEYLKYLKLMYNELTFHYNDISFLNNISNIYDEIKLIESELKEHNELLHYDELIKKLDILEDTEKINYIKSNYKNFEEIVNLIELKYPNILEQIENEYKNVSKKDISKEILDSLDNIRKKSVINSILEEDYNFFIENHNKYGYSKSEAIQKSQIYQNDIENNYYERLEKIFKNDDINIVKNHLNYIIIEIMNDKDNRINLLNYMILALKNIKEIKYTFNEDITYIFKKLDMLLKEDNKEISNKIEEIFKILDIPLELKENYKFNIELFENQFKKFKDDKNIISDIKTYKERNLFKCIIHNKQIFLDNYKNKGTIYTIIGDDYEFFKLLFELKIISKEELNMIFNVNNEKSKTNSKYNTKSMNMTMSI